LAAGAVFGFAGGFFVKSAGKTPAKKILVTAAAIFFMLFSSHLKAYSLPTYSAKSALFL